MSASIAYPVRSPSWVLTYQGVNITTDISRMVLSIEYVDELGGRASSRSNSKTATGVGRAPGFRSRETL